MVTARVLSASILVIFGGIMLLVSPRAHAITSPYVTVQTNVPLNQATSDSINGLLPYFNSHPPLEGSINSLVDAITPSTPTGNVILGPDNTWVGVAWDFGDPGSGFTWKLDRVDLWISGTDNLRKGYRADLSISSSGNVDDFAVITNSQHWDGMSQNAQFNYVRYDFPDHFIAGATTDQDRYPVNGFRYLRVNSRGDTINNGVEDVDWQSRFVEVDIWVSKLELPHPKITSASRNGNGDVALQWSTISGRVYDIEYKLDLNDPGWTHLDTVLGDSDAASYTDYSTTDSQRYYRIVQEP